MKRSRLVRTAWTLAAIAVLVLVTRTFVGDVYHVDSASMEPTLWGTEGGGEWVFVLYDGDLPARHDLVVAQRIGDDAPIVKRVAGRPGERVQIAGGDVLVDGKHRPESERRPPWLCVFDQRAMPLEERFPISAARRALWRNDAGQATLDAREVPRNGDMGLLLLHDPLNDDYLGPQGELVRGSNQVNDARIEGRVRILDAGSQLRLGLSEQGDLFEALVRPLDDGQCELAITRRNAADELATLASARAPLKFGEPRRFAFQNRDNVLRLEFEGAPPLVASYRENKGHPSDQLQEGRSFGYRVWWGGDRGRFEFSAVRVLRDLCHTDRGAYAVGAPLELGPDEYFLLGDYSGQSRDSREWGPVRADEIVGRPVAVVWPPSRWRRLSAVESGS